MVHGPEVSILIMVMRKKTLHHAPRIFRVGRDQVLHRFDGAMTTL